MSIEKKRFGEFQGKEVEAYTLTNKGGASLTVLTYGGIMNKLLVPDREGKLSDVVCGFDTVEDYYSDRGSYSGAIVGRYGNRISGGGFTLNGKFYKIENNEGGKCHLHGGNTGLSRRVYNAEAIPGEGSDKLVLSTFSPDGEDGYPGNLHVRVTYTFDDENAVTIHYEAISDLDTILNLTSHTYYNLNGYDGGSVMEQELFLDSDKYDAVNDLMLPFGPPVPVDGTPFDFRVRKPISVPFDHSFVLNGESGKLRRVGQAYDPKSGRTMTLFTDLPAVQLYTAVGMNGSTNFKGGVPQRKLHAFCLETQFAPDTPNRPDMPSCFLPAYKTYDSTTKFVFGVE